MNKVLAWASVSVPPDRGWVGKRMVIPVVTLPGLLSRLSAFGEYLFDESRRYRFPLVGVG